MIVNKKSHFERIILNNDDNENVDNNIHKVFSTFPTKIYINKNIPILNIPANIIVDVDVIVSEIQKKYKSENDIDKFTDEELCILSIQKDRACDSGLYNHNLFYEIKNENNNNKIYFNF